MSPDPPLPTATWTDPWATAVEADQAGPALLRPVLAWLLGAVGPLLFIWDYSGHDLGGTAAAGAAAVVYGLAQRLAARRWGWNPFVAVSAAAGLGLVLARPDFRFTSVAVLAILLTLAEGAVEGWSPWPGRPSVRAPLAVGPILVTELYWYRNGSRPVTVVLLATCALVVAAYRWWPRPLAAIDRRAATGVRLLRTAIARAFLLVFALPLLYLPGVIGRLIAAPRARRLRSASGWITVTTSVGEAKRDAVRPFTTTAAAVRARRTAFGVLAIIVLVIPVVVARNHLEHAQSRVDAALAPPSARSATTVPARPQALAVANTSRYSDIPSYRDSPWADELQTEELTQERQFGNGFQGSITQRYFNVTDGVRATLAPRPCQCPTVSMWFSGGSAAFGEGQRDDFTIASDLVRLASRDHIQLNVKNVAHDGFTFYKELHEDIAPRLQAEKPPGLIVFYDGWNDAAGEVVSDYVHGFDPSRVDPGVADGDIDEINGTSQAFFHSKIGPQAGRAAAARYRATQAQVAKLTGPLGVQTDYFLQTDSLSSAFQLRNSYGPGAVAVGATLHSPLAAALDSFEADVGASAQDLRHLFDHYPKPLFVGMVHQNEPGAELVAEQIYRQIKPELERLAH